VHLDKANGGFAIDRIELAVRGKVEGLSDEDFVRSAEEAKANCPVSRALAGVEITVEAELEH
jgi:osmotically inducible protein OsmC